MCACAPTPTPPTHPPAHKSHGSKKSRHEIYLKWKDIVIVDRLLDQLWVGSGRSSQDDILPSCKLCNKVKENPDTQADYFWPNKIIMSQTDTHSYSHDILGKYDAKILWLRRSCTYE